MPPDPSLRHNLPTESLVKRGLKKPAQEQELWIGTHSRGEVPLDYPPDTYRTATNNVSTTQKSLL
jgi:hypothetical protein